MRRSKVESLSVVHFFLIFNIRKINCQKSGVFVQTVQEKPRTPVSLSHRVLVRRERPRESRHRDSGVRLGGDSQKSQGAGVAFMSKLSESRKTERGCLSFLHADPRWGIYFSTVPGGFQSWKCKLQLMLRADNDTLIVICISEQECGHFPHTPSGDLGWSLGSEGREMCMSVWEVTQRLPVHKHGARGGGGWVREASPLSHSTDRHLLPAMANPGCIAGESEPSQATERQCYISAWLSTRTIPCRTMHHRHLRLAAGWIYQNEDRNGASQLGISHVSEWAELL